MGGYVGHLGAGFVGAVVVVVAAEDVGVELTPFGYAGGEGEIFGRFELQREGMIGST